MTESPIKPRKLRETLIPYEGLNPRQKIKAQRLWHSSAELDKKFNLTPISQRVEDCSFFVKKSGRVSSSAYALTDGYAAKVFTALEAQQ